MVNNTKFVQQLIEYKLLLEPYRLRVRCQGGHKDKNGVTFKWNPIFLTDEWKQSIYDPYDYIYGKYISNPYVQSLYQQYGDCGSIFRSVDIIFLMISIFESKNKENPPGSKLNIAKMNAEQACLASFPIHDYDDLQMLAEKWLVAIQMPLSQPFDDIRNYFGEKIGLYFFFLGFYTDRLIYVSLIGVGVYIFGVLSSGANPEFFLNPVFSGIMITWTALFIENWKGKMPQ